MGWKYPPVYGKHSIKYYDKKIEKIDNKIAKLGEEKAIYETKRAELVAKEEPKTEVVEG